MKSEESPICDWKAKLKASLGVIGAALMMAAIFTKWSANDDEQVGHFGMPLGTFGMWNVYMVCLLGAIILGEVNLCVRWIGNFPLLLSRSGRGILLLFIFLETICGQALVIILSASAGACAIFNIIAGWRNEQVTVKFSSEKPRDVEMYSIKQNPAVSSA